MAGIFLSPFALYYGLLETKKDFNLFLGENVEISLEGAPHIHILAITWTSTTYGECIRDWRLQTIRGRQISVVLENPFNTLSDNTIPNHSNLVDCNNPILQQPF